MLRVLTCARYFRSVLALSRDLASEAVDFDSSEVEVAEEEEGSSSLLSAKDEDDEDAAPAEVASDLAFINAELSSDDDVAGAMDPKEKLTEGFFGGSSSLGAEDDARPPKEKLTAGLSAADGVVEEAPPKEKLTDGLETAAEPPNPLNPENALDPPAPRLQRQILTTDQGDHFVSTYLPLKALQI